MGNSQIGKGIGAICVALVIATLALRTCRSGVEPSRVDSSEAAASSTLQRAQSSARLGARAERPVPAPAEAVADAALQTTAEPPAVPPPGMSPEIATLLHRPDPLIVTVSCRGKPVEGCTFAIRRGDDTSRVKVGCQIAAATPSRYEVAIPDGEEFPLTLVVSAAGWADVLVVAPTRNAPLDARLPEGGVVTGLVRRASGAVIAGARVVLAERTATSGDDGRLRFEDVALGRHTSARVSIGPISRTLPCDVELTQPGESRDVTLVVPDSTPLRVRVVRDADGVPVVGADVRVFGFDTSDESETPARTDQYGRATLHDLPPGEMWVTATGDDIRRAVAERVRVPSDDETVLRARAYAVHRAWGRIVSPDGRPIAGATVSFSDVAADTVTDSEGRFEATTRAQAALGDGATDDDGPLWCTLEVVQAAPDPHRYDAAESTRRFSVPWDEESTLTWQPRIHVTGTIRNDSGAPITQLSISQFVAGGEQAHFTDERFAVPHGASRRFTWKSAAPGAGSILVTFRGATHRAAIDIPDHASGPTDLGVIAFGPPARIRFTGADGATTRVFVCAWDPATGSVVVDGGLPVWVVCDADAGWISKLPLAPGRRRLLVLAAGRLAADVGDVELGGAPVTDVGVRLARPADVVVHARDADRVVSGASVVVAPVDPPPLFETLRTLSGMWARSILDATRTRLTGVALHRFSGPGMDLATTTDAAGRAWVTRLPAGRLRITVTAPDGGASREVIVELVEGETTDVDVDLAR